jgi:hypothetical protein
MNSADMRAAKHDGTSDSSADLVRNHDSLPLCNFCLAGSLLSLTNAKWVRCYSQSQLEPKVCSNGKEKFIALCATPR